MGELFSLFVVSLFVVLLFVVLLFVVSLLDSFSLGCLCSLLVARLFSSSSPSMLVVSLLSVVLCFVTFSFVVGIP